MAVVIDPDGDLLITLTPPAGPFAVWPYGEDDSDDYVTHTDDGPVQFKVSSKHLCLVSPRFKIMLTGRWREATTIYPDGMRHVDMEGFHPDAFEIVMNILHCHNDEVAQVLSLESLAQICMVVDDLQCHRAVHAFSQIWTRTLPTFTQGYKDFHNDDQFDSSFDRWLIMSIFVSSVLEAPKLFHNATRTAILVCWTEAIPTLGFPISGKLVDAIRAKRETVLEALVTRIHAIFEGLVKESSDNPHCGISSCQLLLAGHLVSAMMDTKLYPRPSKPFDGVAIYTIFCAMTDMSTCDLGNAPLCRNPTPCTLKRHLGPVIGQINDVVTGLDLEDFRPRRSQR